MTPLTYFLKPELTAIPGTEDGEGPTGRIARNLLADETCRQEIARCLEWRPELRLSIYAVFNAYLPLARHYGWDNDVKSKRDSEQYTHPLLPEMLADFEQALSLLSAAVEGFGHVVSAVSDEAEDQTAYRPASAQEAAGTPPAGEVRPPEQMSPMAMAIAFMSLQAKRSRKLPTIPEVEQAVPNAKKSTLYRDPAFKAARRAIKVSLLSEIPKGHKTAQGTVEANDDEGPDD
jgi:hypothetical protein